MNELTKLLIYKLYKDIDRAVNELKNLKYEIDDPHELKKAMQEKIELIEFLESRQTLIRTNTEHFENLYKKRV